MFGPMGSPHRVSIAAPMILWVVVSLFLFSTADGVPSVEEYTEMTKYLEFINRPGIKIITDEYGGVFDCVDIHKQPALDHPLHGNCKIQTEPPFLPDEVDNGEQSRETMRTGLPDGGCPLGTVPIRRVHLEELIRAGSVSNIMNKYGKSSQSSKRLKSTYHEYAVQKMIGGEYYGTRVTISVWNPKPRLLGKEIFSLSQLWVANGAGKQLNTIEVGWQVYPRLYGDSATHLFVFWTRDGYNTGGCYNSMCRGFVQVDYKIVPAMSLNTSAYGGAQVEITLAVVRNNKTGDWWLSFKEGNSSSIWVGYWPSYLFAALKPNANRVDWGGEVAGDTAGTYPPMGSDYFPSEGYGKSSVMKQIQYIDATLAFVDVPTNLTERLSKPTCYKLEDKGNDHLDGFGRNFFYGGPGGSQCNSLLMEGAESADHSSDI